MATKVERDEMFKRRQFQTTEGLRVHRLNAERERARRSAAPAKLHDYRGDPVAVGDLVLEDRGLVFRITDDSLYREGLAHGVQVVVRGLGTRDKGEPRIVRVYHMLRVNADDICRTAWHNAQLYKNLYIEAKISEVQHERLLERKQLVDRELREMGIRK